MVAVIGDIHGCYRTFLALFEKIIKKYPGIPTYCVGDLVDRGNFSYEVVKFFMENSSKIKFSVGNHDLMFYSFIKEPNSLLGNAFLFNGSEPTLNSYLKHKDEVYRHIEFLHNAPFFYNLDDCFISHAGISNTYNISFDINNPGNSETLNKIFRDDVEDENSIIWTREKLKNIGKLQVVGHTKQNEVRLDKSSNALYIDTGACVGKKLSCVIIEAGKVTEIISENTVTEDIK